MMTSRLSRRDFLKASTLAALASSLPSWMPRLAFAQPYNDPRGDVLVVVFLRGGADTLNMVVPHGEAAYYAARPRLAIPRPDAAGEALRVLDLDGFFGLHPALAPLLPAFREGHLAAIHATGSPHDTRSHFEAMDFMERGSPGEYTLTSGWVGRHLASLAPESPSPVRAVGWGAAVQQALTGGPSVVAMQSIIDFHLAGDTALAFTMLDSLRSIYAIDGGSLAAAAESTAQAIDLVQAVGYADYVPDHGAVYPEDEFGQALRQTAALIRAQVGLEAACIDLGGWDTHALQGGAEGLQARLMAQLAEGLAAFRDDLGPELGRVTVVVMSEFGRRLEENASGGTDHGHGGAMLLMNGDLAASVPVVARWPGLGEGHLDRGDLQVTIDYRSVLAEVVGQRLKNDALTDVFPNFTAERVGLFGA
ncbi:MAG: DUF1501 domain-containing protein [Chloroflexi bacterium]|nr:DUF1501 domain-containing protein [Chloroflexota bacterium]